MVKTEGHSKLPWKISGTSWLIDAYTGVIVNVNDCKEDAEFIVRACNSHDKLVEALKEVISCFPHNVPVGTEVAKLRLMAEEAIKEAEGE